MIPPDVASSLRSVLTESQSATQQAQQTQPVAATQRIADVLGNLVPGQRIMAEIQGMQANGTYRATVGQREITLSLPFSAKAGDSLELEVTESDGKLTLAFVANRGEPAAKGQPASVATSLSSTGQMIGDLLQELTADGKRAPAAPLNGNQALVQSMPKDAAQLVPVLKQALTQSGMFYEAHQARWAAGRLPTEQLRQEPQGRLPAPASSAATGNIPAPTASPPQRTAGPNSAAAGFPGGAAASSTNSLPAAAGTMAPAPGSAPQASGSMPTPTVSVPVDGIQASTGDNPARQALPPPTSGQPQPSPAPQQQAQALPGQAATPPEPPSGAATSPQTATAAAANASPPSAPPPLAQTATPQPPTPQATQPQATQPQATLPQATPGMSPPTPGTPSAPATVHSQTPPPSQGASLPENTRATNTPLPPPLIRQGNLTYEAFPPRNAWLQGAEVREPATTSPPAQPSPFSASIQRTETSQPGLPSPAQPPRDEAATLVKTANGAPSSPAESSRDNTRSPIVSTSAPTTGTEKAQSAGLAPGPSGIPRDIAPLVQQQLDGLANQNYAWQGQIWPGQNLWWEIGEGTENSSVNDDDGKRWQTRLKLSLPILGDVDARISLQGSGQLSLRIAAGDAASAAQLQEHLAELRQQFENAGLATGQMRVDHDPLPQAKPAA